jgi:uncharacterized protein
VARGAPFALYMLVLALGPLIRGALPEGFDDRWIYALQIALPLAAIGYLWPRYRELGRGATPGLPASLLGVAVGVAVFAIWIRLDFAPFVIGTSDGFDPRDGSGSVLVGLVATRLFGAVLVVPIMEELFWRSFIMRWLEKPSFLAVDPKSVGLMPLAVSSALFASAHHLWFAGLLAGLAYGWLYVRTGNLWVPVISHAVTNALLGWWVLSTGSWTFW